MGREELEQAAASFGALFEDQFQQHSGYPEAHKVPMHLL